MLVREAGLSDLPEWKRHVVLLLDAELSSGEVATHTDFNGSRYFFFRLRFPYAHFPTTGITGDFIFLIVWEAIERLENLGFKVLVITADDASANRKFF